MLENGHCTTWRCFYTSCSFSDRSIFVSDFQKIPINFHRFLIIIPSKSPSPCYCSMSKLVEINQWSWRRSKKCGKVCRPTPNKRKCDQKSSLWLSPTQVGYRFKPINQCFNDWPFFLHITSSFTCACTLWKTITEHVYIA